MTAYAHPEAPVSTDWVVQRKGSPNLRLVEVDVDTTAYKQSHVSGAFAWNWPRSPATSSTAT